MKRVDGNSDVALLECVNPVKNRWHLRWDVQTNNDGTASYMEKVFSYKPSMSEIKTTLLGWCNSIIDGKILSGFVWKDTPVWLSPENQSNFKAAYDLAHQTGGATLPVKFKLGESPEGEPLYFTFEDMAVFTDFYSKALKYIQETLSDGWEIKDAFNPEEYRVK